VRRLIAILLENEAGALSRVIGLFAQRNYNIETLNVAPTDDPTLSRVTLSTTGDEERMEQITKHLNRLIEVVKVVDLSDGDHIERELMLIKVRAEGEMRDEVRRCCEIFRGQVIDVARDAYTIELTGTAEKLDAFMSAMDEATILEVVRSGVSGVGRGDKIMSL